MSYFADRIPEDARRALEAGPEPRGDTDTPPSGGTDPASGPAPKLGTSPETMPPRDPELSLREQVELDRELPLFEDVLGGEPEPGERGGGLSCAKPGAQGGDEPEASVPGDPPENGNAGQEVGLTPGSGAPPKIPPNFPKIGTGDGDDSLDDTRRWLLKRLEHGASCPACGQFAKIYRRKINSAMAAGLIAAYRRYGLEFGYLPDLRRDTRNQNFEESKLAHWGLMVEEPILRPDGGRAGWWAVTKPGEAWVLRRSTVSKYAHIYRNKRFAYTGDLVTIEDALGSKFNYRELMDGV